MSLSDQQHKYGQAVLRANRAERAMDAANADAQKLSEGLTMAEINAVLDLVDRVERVARGDEESNGN